MNLFQRLSRFGAVGLLATAIHLAILLLLTRQVGQPIALANLVAFIVAFVFSTTAQQSFTFRDRLEGKSLKKRSLSTLFLVNALLAYVLGRLAHGGEIMALALVPPFVNFALLHLFSGHPAFKRSRNEKA